MKGKIYFFSLMSMILLWSMVSSSAAQEAPLELVKQSISRILDLLGSPEYKDESTRPQAKEKIYSIADERFSWQEMGKRSLGRAWKQQSPEDQEKFISLFADLLKHNYIDKLEVYGGEEITYDKDILKGKYAEVRTSIVQKTGENVPVFYRMINKGKGWYVYDVVIEGISLVKNYRSQFDDMLRKSTFQEFLQKLEEKVNELKTE